MTRAEHLRWCKDRALECLPDAGAVMSSLIQNLGAHPETSGSVGIVTGLMMPLTLIGQFEKPGELRKFIEGFN